MITSKFTKHSLEGVWFAVAALVPVSYYFLRFGGEVVPVVGGSPFLTAVLPLLLSGFGGLFFGAQILDPHQTPLLQQAVGRGLAISSLAYFLMFSVSAIASAIGSEGDVLGGIVTFLFLFIYGLLFVGWLVLLTGAAAAGGLLYLCRSKIIRAQEQSEMGAISQKL